MMNSALLFIYLPSYINCGKTTKKNIYVYIIHNHEISENEIEKFIDFFSNEEENYSKERLTKTKRNHANVSRAVMLEK